MNTAANLITFPAEPEDVGTKVVAHTDGFADGNVWERQDVQEAIPPRGTRRWKIVSLGLAGWTPSKLALDNASYRTWADVMVDVLAGSRSTASIEVLGPDEELPERKPAPERCDPKNGVHATPHRGGGCFLR